MNNDPQPPSQEFTSWLTTLRLLLQPLLLLALTGCGDPCARELSVATQSNSNLVAALPVITNSYERRLKDRFALGYDTGKMDAVREIFADVDQWRQSTNTPPSNP